VQQAWDCMVDCFRIWSRYFGVRKESVEARSGIERKLGRIEDRNVLEQDRVEVIDERIRVDCIQCFMTT